MSIPEVGKKIRVTVPSTTANLGPGFDCLGAALDLYNEFIFTRIEGGGDRFDLIMESTDGNHLRGGPENLVFRAAQKVWEAANMKPFALEARVKLAVPPARGLGSSATAIVAGLIGANAIMNSPLSKEKLLELAIDIDLFMNLGPGFKALQKPRTMRIMRYILSNGPVGSSDIIKFIEGTKQNESAGRKPLVDACLVVKDSGGLWVATNLGRALMAMMAFEEE